MAQCQDYLDYVPRAAATPIGRRVKVANLRDNLDLSRLRHITEDDIRRLDKHWHAIMLIQELDREAVAPSEGRSVGNRGKGGLRE